MDAYVQLALIEKAKRVFADDPGVMLSFPLLSPLTFTPAELAALMAPATAADYAAAADFAHIVNFLPKGVIASVSDRSLWQIYADILTRADVATGAGAGTVPSDTSDLLYTSAEDGSRTESEAYKRYRQYRDAWLVAREDYASHKLSGELSEDPQVRHRWQDLEEPALRAVLDDAATAWETLGQRSLIESALVAERVAALNDPRRCWSEWSQAYAPDIDLVTDAGGNAYAPTGLSPRDFVEAKNWLTFDLSASEMQALVASAPDVLKVVLDDDVKSDIEHVSFEYRSVALTRPWFNPDVLTSRIWRSGDPDLALSDGGEPPKGVCPAYAAACVFVRNIEVVVRGTTIGRSFRDLHLAIDPKWLALNRGPRLDPAVTALVKADFVRPVAAAQVFAPRVLPAFQALETASFAVAPAMVRATPRALVPMQGRFAPRISAAAAIRIDREHFGPGPAATPPPVPRPASDELSILAFICKRMPRAPDPDPNLRWD